MTDPLLTCPFCGGDASIGSLGQYYDDEQNKCEDFVVGCNQCSALFPPTGCESSAIEAWNTRTPSISYLEWQPIETAPKDETEILLWIPGVCNYPIAGHYTSAAQFEKDYGDPEYMEEGWYLGYGYPGDLGEEVHNPTHWMPLPKPPALAALGTGEGE